MPGHANGIQFRACLLIRITTTITASGEIIFDVPERPQVRLRFPARRDSLFANGGVFDEILYLVIAEWTDVSLFLSSILQQD